jgi:2C-methyl-D-erythritol 2,4-cyclodiphosphate synthase
LGDPASAKMLLVKENPMNTWCCYKTEDFATAVSQKWCLITQQIYMSYDNLDIQLIYDKKKMKVTKNLMFFLCQLMNGVVYLHRKTL